MTGSSFEIDEDANLIVDVTGNSDWASVNEIRKNDEPSGQNDNSYSGGAKEDDTCPSTGTGSIPNNKSDLKTFGVYVEEGTGGSAGFLNLFWSRVQEPTGTTLMDFEFNQQQTKCANGVNPIRTAGDLLIEYEIDQGGAQAEISLREWTGTQWGPEVTITDAVGTINNTPIAGADSDGLGALSARTFGEAQISLDAIFEEDKCVSFGSAFVKSRSSDAFNSALKDFIAPTDVNITNCGKVIIRKQTDPQGATDLFTFSHTLQTDPAQSTQSFQLADDGVKQFTNVLFGTGYTVTEDSPLPSGFELVGVDCSASTGVTPQINGATVTFAIDDESDILDCTYTNRAKGTIVIEKVSNGTSGTFPFTSTTLGAFSLTTTAAGTAGKATQTFADIAPGSYDASETTPAGWSLVSATCSDGSSPTAISLSAGETVTCTFTNTPLTNVTVSVDSIVPGGTSSSITCTGPVSINTDATGDGALTLPNLLPGTYTCTVVIQ